MKNSIICKSNEKWWNYNGMKENSILLSRILFDGLVTFEWNFQMEFYSIKIPSISHYFYIQLSFSLFSSEKYCLYFQPIRLQLRKYRSGTSGTESYEGCL